MANTPTISPLSIEKLEENLFNATIQIVINDGTEDIFTFTASKKFRKSTPLNDIDLEGTIKPVLRKKIKAVWDAFVKKELEEQTILASQGFITLCSDLQDEFEIYINQG